MAHPTQRLIHDIKSLNGDQISHIGDIQLHFLHRLAREEELLLEKVFQIGADVFPDSRLSLELTMRGYVIVLRERCAALMHARGVWKVRKTFTIAEMKEIYDSAVLYQHTAGRSPNSMMLGVSRR